MASTGQRPSVRTSALRTKVEHASHGALTHLTRLPPWAPLVAAVALAAVGVATRGPVGVACFAVLSLLLGWLLYLSWPRLRRLDRLMRSSVLLLTVVLTLVLAVPR